MVIQFGKFKGQEIAEIAKTMDGVKWLSWAVENIDVNDPKFGAKNKALVSAIRTVLQAKLPTESAEKPAVKKDTDAFLLAINEKLKILLELQAGMLKINKKIEDLTVKISAVLPKVEAADEFGLDWPGEGDVR